MLTVLAALALAFVDPAAAVEAALRTAPAGAARAEAATRPFVGAPYLASPLGEGRGRDPDPRFRLDAFDCMTLVETAVALGSAASLDEARLALDDVRYAGAPALGARNHEVLSQWIPRNAAAGWIREVTPSIAGARARAVERELTPEAWALVRASGRGIAGLPTSRLPLGRFGVTVLPAADVPATAAAIPSGTIAFVVRAAAEDRATWITHAGLVVRGAGGQTLVRHATSSRGVARVIEEPIERFVRRERRARPAWPLEGLALFTIGDNRSRVRTLDAGSRRAPPTDGRPPARAPARL